MIDFVLGIPAGQTEMGWFAKYGNVLKFFACFGVCHQPVSCTALYSDGRHIRTGGAFAYFRPSGHQAHTAGPAGLREEPKVSAHKLDWVRGRERPLCRRYVSDEFFSLFLEGGVTIALRGRRKTPANKGTYEHHVFGCSSPRTHPGARKNSERCRILI